MTTALRAKSNSVAPKSAASISATAINSTTEGAVAKKSAKLDVSAMTDATPSSRNRAIDAYRAMAMCAVAVGHWLAADVRLNAEGSLSGGNALDKLGSLHILTWIFQVMPLFFCIGGFSNAASLDGHWRKGGTSADWVRARLRRLVAPASWLAGTSLSIVVLSQVFGFMKDTVLDASAVAAIPLWFLANYVADTALAPITLRLFRSHRTAFVSSLLALFLACESTRFFSIHYVLQINIVVGWLLFQVIGFAWRDGLLPKPETLHKVSVLAFAAAGALVAFGPWPLAMVSVPGARFANTWPPSLALLVYGIGSCAFYIAAAPAVSRFLEARSKVWKVVVVANSMTMTSYLWHFTALAIAAAVAMPLHLLPTASIGSGAWWLAKLPIMGIAFVVLAGIVMLLSGKERAGLLGSKAVDGRSAMHAAVAAITMAAGFEMWTSAEGNLKYSLAGMLCVLIARALVSAKSSHDKD
jgi:hypothetical protein